MWEGVFSGVNLIAIGGWLLLLAAPRTPLVTSAVMYLGVGLLCLIYTGCFIAALAAGGGMAQGSGFSIAGVRAFFAADSAVVIGWTHYLALDLFAGLWIGRDADSKLVSRLVQAPFLLLTFGAGPVGLLAWLGLREGRARAQARSAGRRHG